MRKHNKNRECLRVQECGFLHSKSFQCVLKHSTHTHTHIEIALDQRSRVWIERNNTFYIVMSPYLLNKSLREKKLDLKTALHHCFVHDANTTGTTGFSPPFWHENNEPLIAKGIKCGFSIFLRSALNVFGHLMTKRIISSCGQLWFHSKVPRWPKVWMLQWLPII